MQLGMRPVRASTMHSAWALVAVTAAVALASPANAAASDFVGTTSQGQRLTFSALYPKVLNLRYRAEYVCTFDDGSTARVTQPTSVASLAFDGERVNSHLENSSGSDTADFTARITFNGATGTFRETYTSEAGGSCSSGRVSWRASNYGCGRVRAYYRERGTRQYVEASHIHGYGVSCARARHVAYTWAHHSRLSYGPARYGAGFRCQYNRQGSDVGAPVCRSGNRSVSFDAYDSSGFH